MAENPQPRVDGGGILGFGCAFVIVALVGVAVAGFHDSYSLAVVLALALVAGLLGAKYGDSFHAWVLSKLRWFWWP